jgi:hypothetical protein
MLKNNNKIKINCQQNKKGGSSLPPPYKLTNSVHHSEKGLMFSKKQRTLRHK